MGVLEQVVGFLNTYVWSYPEELPWLVVVLLGTGLFITLRLGFIQLRRVPHALAIVAGKYDHPDDKGDISHFQALSTALSATVGIGNIAGVATAIHYGGPGAIFWMWVTAAFGMALKYAECTLAVHYRDFDEAGLTAGGPMYYIERGLGRKWRPMALLFAFAGISASFGGGNMNQANTVAVSASTDLGLPPVITGIVAATFVGAVILGGIKRIARVSSSLAPSMAAVYVLGALTILALNAGEIPAALSTIVSDAFAPRASVSGSVAGVFSVTLLWGVKRGLFSNEAGQGSAPIAHAAARTDEPVREGAVAMLEPLIDTLIICTMTALVIVTTGVWDEKHPGELRMNEIKVVPTRLLDGQGTTEQARISTALEAAAQVDGGPTAIAVEDGRQDVLTFIGRNSVVENARLIGVNGEPFSGTLQYRPGKGFDVEGLLVRGEMLQNSSALTALAFRRGLSPIGDFGNYIVTLCVFLFALSTMISWSYYGDRCVTYLIGGRFVLYYRMVYTVVVFLGSVLALEVVWAYGDLALGVMSVPNLVAVLLLSPKVVELTRRYFRSLHADREERS